MVVPRWEEQNGSPCSVFGVRPIPERIEVRDGFPHLLRPRPVRDAIHEMLGHEPVPTYLRDDVVVLESGVLFLQHLYLRPVPGGRSYFHSYQGPGVKRGGHRCRHTIPPSVLIECPELRVQLLVTTGDRERARVLAGQDCRCCGAHQRSDRDAIWLLQSDCSCYSFRGGHVF